MHRAILPTLAMAGMLLAAGGPATAQGWPAGPIRMMVPFAPGSNNDTIGRLLGNHLGTALGVPVVVDNRPGAGGNIGAELAARAAPDGQTLFLGNSSHAISVTLYDKLGYDLLRDFAPVTLIGSAPYFITVHPSLPARSLKDLIGVARKRPGDLNIGSAGAGTYLWVELFKSAMKIDAAHVVYKGTPQVAAAVLSGEISVGLVTTVNAIPQVKAGRLHGVAVTGEKRSPLLPEVPTVIEAGQPVLEAATWYGLLVPAATSKDIVSRLHRESVKALGQADLRERFDRMDVAIAGSTPEQFGAFIRAEVARWGKVVKASGAKPN
ncbi:MAG: tripartite tricarboxylate transporter substrate binding protein [bacterium]|jgi:tripartite-type tricarboxylate transporter receptor subunit TctC